MARAASSCNVLAIIMFSSFFFFLGRPTSVGKALSFTVTHELSFVLFFFLLYQSTAHQLMKWLNIGLLVIF